MARPQPAAEARFMSGLRDGVRRSVVLGASLLREAGAGVRDAVGELTDPRRAEQQRLHDELEQARREGRWLSDDERAHRLLDQQKRSQRRRLLLVLLVISLLLPPLWLLVPVWCGLLWLPQTTRRLLVLGLALGASLAVLVVLALLWLLLR